MFQIPYTMFWGNQIIDQLSNLISGGTFRTKGNITQAVAADDISCLLCFDSILTPPSEPTGAFNTPIPTLPDQPLIALDEVGLVISAYTVSGALAIPSLDGNTEGAVFYQLAGSLAAYMFQGLYYVCVCVQLPNGFYPNPAQAILNKFVSFNLVVTYAPPT